MGACNSHSAIAVGNYQLTRSQATPTATVISFSGDLRRWKAPIAARQVLESEPTESFLCNSDALVYEEFISALNPNEELLSDNLYFILPKTKLRHRLNASDMAGLAVRASLALQRNNEKNVRASPVNHHPSSVSVHKDNEVTVGGSGLRKTKISQTRNHLTYVKSCSDRKFQNTRPSKQVKLAVRSSRMRRLSTIYEASEH